MKKQEPLPMQDETIVVIQAHSRPNELGAYYLDIPEHGTLALTKMDEVWKLQLYNEEFTDFTDLSDEVQYACYGFVYDNRHQLLELMKNALVEVESVEDLSWVVPPIPIMAPNSEAGKEPIAIGSLAIAREVQLEDKELRSILFISPDGTWTTLTCYVTDEVAGIEIAKSDLKLIGQHIAEFIDKL